MYFMEPEQLQGARRGLSFSSSERQIRQTGWEEAFDFMES
jgi:hypothetical protein